MCDRFVPILFIGGYVFVLFKHFLNNKELFYTHLIDRNMFIISGNVFLVIRKQLLCVRAKTGICERLRTFDIT